MGIIETIHENMKLNKTTSAKNIDTKISLSPFIIISEANGLVLVEFGDNGQTVSFGTGYISRHWRVV